MEYDHDILFEYSRSILSTSGYILSLGYYFEYSRWCFRHEAVAPVTCVRLHPSIRNRGARDVEKWVQKGMFGVRERSRLNSG